MFKKKSIDGSLCFCPLPPLPELNPTVSAWEWAVCLPCLCACPAASPAEGGTTKKIHVPFSLQCSPLWRLSHVVWRQNLFHIQSFTGFTGVLFHSLLSKINREKSSKEALRYSWLWMSWGWNPITGCRILDKPLNCSVTLSHLKNGPNNSSCVQGTL